MDQSEVSLDNVLNVPSFFVDPVSQALQMVGNYNIRFTVESRILTNSHFSGP